jgi:D-lactate dehydrogenase (cytochrome)
MNTAVDFSLNLLPRPMPAAMSGALRARFGERFVTSMAVREQHGRDESPFDAPPPEAVVFCESTEEVAFVVATAAEHRVPVIPYGAGSSLEGHLLAVQGGVSVDVSRMNRLLRLNPEDLTVTVQAGVTRCSSTARSRIRGCSSPSIRARTRRWAACRPRARRVPMPCATARCARTCWR